MQKMMRAALVLLVALSLLFETALAEEKPVLQVHQLNVGCANCYLIVCGDAYIVIDCGIDQEKTAPEVDKYLAAAGVDALDACIITHYHRDHIRNMNRVLAGFGDENTVVYGPSKGFYNKEYLPLAAGSYRQMVNYDEIQIGDVHLTCVGPTDTKGGGNINKDSLNILLTYGSHKFLFTGDYVRSADIIDQHEELVRDIDVLQFPHHGLEPYCVDAWVVEIMNPETIVVPGGFGANVEKLLRKRNLTETQVLDTTKGNIVFLSDGAEMEIYTHVLPGQFNQKLEQDEAAAI